MIIENIIFNQRLIESNCFDDISKEFSANVKLKCDSNLDENSAEFRRNIYRQNIFISEAKLQDLFT